MNSSLQPGENQWAALEIPGEPGVYACACHKSVRTRLRCGRCEKPICPKCTQYGPTGARCRDCLSLKSSHMYRLSVAGGLAAFGLSVVAGVVGSVILRAIGGLSLLILFYAPAIGPTLGQVLVRASGGKRGTKLALVASAGFVLGALGLPLAAALLVLAHGGPAMTALHLLFEPFLWIMVAVAVGSLWVFLK